MKRSLDMKRECFFCILLLESGSDHTLCFRVIIRAARHRSLRKTKERERGKYLHEEMCSFCAFSLILLLPLLFNDTTIFCF